jgi:hypothetical protein
MFCAIYKWLISQAVNSGKPLSGRLLRHTQRCSSCHEFAQFCESLKAKLAQDKQAILDNHDKALDQKLISAVHKELTSIPGRQAELQKKKTLRPALVPILAAAFLILAVSISIIFLSVPRSEKEISLGRISELVSRASPEDVLGRFESPLEKEYRELKQTLDSTTKFLLSSLNYHIGQQAE